MKTLLSIVLLLAFQLGLHAQTEQPISISYFGPFAIQPGIRVGHSLPLTNLQKETESTKVRTLSLEYKIGAFIQSDLHRNLILETDLVYTRRRANKRSYIAPSIGLAYILSSEKTEGSVNLGNGQITQIKETYHYFLPMLNLEYGKIPTNKLGYFFNVFYGRRISPQQNPIAFPGVEVGFKFLLNPVKVKRNG